MGKNRSKRRKHLRNRGPVCIQASKRKGMIVLNAPSVQVDAAGEAKTFSGVAYTGDMVQVHWGLPVVVDLSKIRPPSKSRPVLFNHNPESPVGHFEPAGFTNSGRDLLVSGVLSGANETTQQIVASAANGFPWQMSIGIDAATSTEVRAGETISVNGREFTGPVIVTGEADLKEISFVSLGADDNTTASVAARYSFQKGNIMSFEDFVRSLSFDPEALTEEARAALQIAYDQSYPDGAGNGDKEDPEDGDGGSASANSGHPNLAAGRIERAARLQEIGALMANPKYAALSAKAKGEVFAMAEKQGISVGHAASELNLALERESRPMPPLPRPQCGGMDRVALQAGIMLRLGIDRGRVERHINKPEAVADGARRFGRVSMRGLIAACCAVDGVSVPMSYDNDDTWLRAAFSTATFPEILKDSMNKYLVDAYEEQPMVSRQLARKLSVNDFKVNTGIMFTRGRPWEKVGSDGQIKNGDIGSEEKFTYAIDTYGEMITFTRQMLKNDDLGVFEDFLSRILNTGILTEERNFFKMFHDNAGSFIGAGNRNLITAPLSIDGLSEAVTAFRKKKNKSDVPINLPPRYLLVPPELEATALQLYQSTEIRPTGDSTGGNMPTANIHRGKYEVIVSAYLSDPAFGNEADLGKCWYLLPDPSLAAAWGRAYLDGQETPTVEEVDVEPNRLGQSFRGYMDFGHCQIDPRCVVKSDGTA